MTKTANAVLYLFKLFFGYWCRSLAILAHKAVINTQITSKSRYIQHWIILKK